MRGRGLRYSHRGNGGRRAWRPYTVSYSMSIRLRSRCSPESAEMVGNGVAWQDPSISSRVWPAGRCATWEAALEGTGMTSEQSTSCLGSWPSTAILAMAAVNLATMDAWSSVECASDLLNIVSIKELGAILTDKGLPLARSARVPGRWFNDICEYRRR